MFDNVDKFASSDVQSRVGSVVSGNIAHVLSANNDAIMEYIVIVIMIF